MWTAQAHSSNGGLTPKKGIEHTVSAQRARLDLNDRSARWREPSKRPMWTATRQEHSGSGLTPKKGIEHRERTTSVSHVLCGRRELSGGGGGLTPKKGIEHRERTTSASRLE